MKPMQTIFSCSNCGAQFTKWIGRCLECGTWGTIVESRIQNLESGNPNSKFQIPNSKANALETMRLDDVKSEATSRLRTDIGELDRVLGGGIVPGSFILIGGEPGIGKSTLALQLANAIPNTLYISGEETVEQIKLRADRLLTPLSPPPHRGENEKNPSPTRGGQGRGPQVANATNVESIIATIEKTKPPLAIIDSIQTIASEEVPGEPGSMTQVRASAVKLLECAKHCGTAIVIIGHVTKDGAVAGPKTLEHLVDTVLSFEGDEHHAIRILRATKNRFGSTDEIGLFDMEATGLVQVTNPSARLLANRGEPMPGSILTCLMEGTRPLLVEIQALVNKTIFGYPVRKASGFDLNRLHVLVAVLQKRASLNLAQYDIHLNVVGGITADEPAADLAVCLAIASAYKDKMLGNDLVVFGEVGLGGEVRAVSHTDRRIKESADRGLKRVISSPIKNIEEKNIKIIAVKNISELIQQT